MYNPRLQASVRALEKNVGEIRAFIEQESETIPKASCSLPSLALNMISISMMHSIKPLPRRLPAARQMRALLEACSQQSEQLQGVASRLPSYLPGTSGRAADAASDGPRAGILTTSGKQNGSRDAGALCVLRCAALPAIHSPSPHPTPEACLWKARLCLAAAEVQQTWAAKLA